MNSRNLYEEKELLVRIAAGDRIAFKAVHDHYWNRLYSTALSYLKSPEWAQDIVQDIFLKLWLKRESLPALDRFPAYLYVMMRNELMSALRKKWDQQPLPDHYEDMLPSGLFHPEHYMHTRKMEEVFQKAIQKLSPQQRQIFTMTREMGLSHEEIAGRLGIDKRTVSNHATTALNKLRQLLRDHPELFLMVLGLCGPWFET